MAPFPEAEDMTVKRLYVALKRNDMQLLQMGAHKLHEKFHSGYEFELKEDLGQILSYVEDQDIPSDIKDLLTRTINMILAGEKPPVVEVEQNENITFTSDIKTEEKSDAKTDIKPEIKDVEQKAPLDSLFSNVPIQKENLVSKNEEIKSEIASAPANKSENFEQDASTSAEIEKEKDNKTVIFTPKEEALKPVVFENEKPAKTEQISIFNYEKPEKPEKQEYTPLEDVAVFYDDKAPFFDWIKNKAYRNGLESISLGKTSSFEESFYAVKDIVDVPTDEIGEIIKMLNTIKGEIYFVTSSKSENILKTFTETGVNYEIPLVQTNEEVSGKITKLVPMFGLSNLFVCPKCGKREACVTKKGKILTIGCKSCSSSMYPDIYEASNSETNANVYFWLDAIKAMSGASTWILINPPLEPNKAIVTEFLKTAYALSKPKKVYILSKETTKKEYFKQAFLEINSSCVVKSEYLTQGALCEDFINNEMSNIKVSV